MRRMTMTDLHIDMDEDGLRIRLENRLQQFAVSDPGLDWSPLEGGAPTMAQKIAKMRAVLGGQLRLNELFAEYCKHRQISWDSFCEILWRTMQDVQRLLIRGGRLAVVPIAA